MLFTLNELEEKEKLEQMASHEDRCAKYISEEIEADLNLALGIPKDGYSYHFDTGGTWSLHDLVVHLIKAIGKCDMYFSTYAIKEYQARLFTGMKEDGLIGDLHCLLDYRNPTLDGDAVQTLERSANTIGYMRTHSKLTVLIGRELSAVVTGSANMTNNTTADTGVITCVKDIAEYRKNWIIKNINENGTQ